MQTLSRMKAAETVRLQFGNRSGTGFHRLADYRIGWRGRQLLSSRIAPH